jgi:hypothetical protein
VLAGTAGADEAMLRPLVALDFGILEWHPRDPGRTPERILRNATMEFAAKGSIRIGDPATAMRQLVAHTFSALLQHPEVIALLNAENLQKGHRERSARIRDLYDPLVQTIADVLRRGEQVGIFRPNIDPITLYLSLSSLAYHYISNQYTLKAAFGIDFTAPERHQAWLVHITEMVVGFCRADAGSNQGDAQR